MTQKEALDILKTGANVFLTGAAGSGKTFVLNQYIDYLKKNSVEVGITASTGIAATHMGGTTIHSWSGIGIKDTLSKDEINEIVEKSYLKNRFKKTSVLVIDEVSMLHHFRLDLVDAILRKAKDNEGEVFGGIQVVLSGDFFQLPPVRRVGEREAFFAYHSNAWKEAEMKTCYLHEQFRQNDLDYLGILNAIRDNNIAEHINDILYSRIGKNSNTEKSTKLYSHNANVDAENEQELSKLPGKVFEYNMESRGKSPLVETLKKGCLAPEVLRLKEGAKVMFVKNNFDEGYANGTLGVVIKCNYDQIKVKTNKGGVVSVGMANWRIEEDGKIKAEIGQYPLRLAWAITVHKSQGMSLDSAYVDLSDAFEKGMGYVALSRVRSLDGLFLKGINQKALEVSGEVLEFDKNFRLASEEHSFELNSRDKEDLLEMHNSFLQKMSPTQKKKKESTVDMTRNMILNEIPLKEMTIMRELTEETIISHIEKIKELEPNLKIDYLKKGLPMARLDKIVSAFRKIGMQEGGKRPLSPVKNILGPNFSYSEIRLVRLFL